MTLPWRHRVNIWVSMGACGAIGSRVPVVGWNQDSCQGNLDSVSQVRSTNMLKRMESKIILKLQANQQLWIVDRDMLLNLNQWEPIEFAELMTCV
jgi:hypothetical protein